MKRHPSCLLATCCAPWDDEGRFAEAIFRRGVWQALAFGFAGVRARGETLELDPRVPAEWRALDLTVVFRGNRGRIHAKHDVLTVDADKSVRISVGGNDGRRFERKDGEWEEAST